MSDTSPTMTNNTPARRALLVTGRTPQGAPNYNTTLSTPAVTPFVTPRPPRSARTPAQRRNAGIPRSPSRRSDKYTSPSPLPSPTQHGGVVCGMIVYNSKTYRIKYDKTLKRKFIRVQNKPVYLGDIRGQYKHVKNNS